MICNSEEEPTIRPFRFLNFWSKHQQFKKIVADNWSVDFIGTPFYRVSSENEKREEGVSSVE